MQILPLEALFATPDQGFLDLWRTLNLSYFYEARAMKNNTMLFSKRNPEKL